MNWSMTICGLLIMEHIEMRLIKIQMILKLGYQHQNGVVMQAYDINGDKKLLDIAEYQLEKVEDFEKDKIYYKINMLQIIKRRGLFSNKEIMILKGLNTENLQEMFGIDVLLEDKEKTRKIYGQLNKEEQEFIAEYPIYYLYQNL